MSCTAQPVFQVNVNQQPKYLCGRCIAEHSNDLTVEIQSEHPVVGETCQCVECE